MDQSITFLNTAAGDCVGRVLIQNPLKEGLCCLEICLPPDLRGPLEYGLGNQL
ncbi:MAG: hypothetical protein KDK39_07980 [Leptospiraceae bacterium]|nr:hypothetical protein [Leptospiraceae bacterium]